MFPPQVHHSRKSYYSWVYTPADCVIEDSATVALECLGNCNGAGNGSPGIDLEHHLFLSSYLTMFSDVVLGQEKGSEMDHGGRGRGGGKGGGEGRGEVEWME